MEVRLTVVGLDLVRSSEFTAELERIMGGPKVVAEFFEDMGKFVYRSFSSVMSNPSEYEIFKSLEGDAFLVSFEKADDAYNFVKTLGQDIEKYNANPEVKKRIFHIGAATGNVYFERSAYEKNSSKIISDLVMRRVARLRDGAQPGYFYVDQETFDGFTDDLKNNFRDEVLVKTKPHETDINARRYQVISDNSTSSNQEFGRQEAFKKLSKLENYQIREVARELNIGENSLSFEVNKKRGELIGDLLDIVERLENFDVLKTIISKLYPGN